jgi:glycosyltransferase involved in cell wall biosynthesis
MNENPLISLFLLSYNQERFVRESVKSALLQTYNPLEIIISDDSSIDQTYNIIKEEVSTYKGPHKIILNRNEKNLGLAGNLNLSLKLSNGKLLVGQAGDDISYPDRTEKLKRRWQDLNSPVDLVCSYFEEIDESGRPTGLIEHDIFFVPDFRQNVIYWKCGATGACASYSRKLYEKYGPLDTRVVSEDWVFSFRAWIEAGIAVVQEPLLKRRTHKNSLYNMHRDVKVVKNPSIRRSRREQAAKNSLAIAEEWLRAWGISGAKENPKIEMGLKRLVRIRKLQACAFDSTRIGALKLGFLILMERGGILNTAKIVRRHVLRMD